MFRDLGLKCKLCERVFDAQDMHDLGPIIGILCDDCVTENDFAYFELWQRGQTKVDD